MKGSKVGKPGGTISILGSSDLRFGGHVDYSVSPAISVDPPLSRLVRLDVTDGHLNILQEGYSGNGSTVNPDGLGGSFHLGPTSSWSGGGGVGKLTICEYDPHTGKWDPIKSTSVDFQIVA